MITLDQGGRRVRAGRMVVLPPPAALRDVAELLWVEERGDVPDPTAAAWRIVPDDAPHLIWSVAAAARGGERARLALVGARTVHTDIDVRRRRLTVGVRLRAGTLPALFGVDAAALADRSCLLADAAGDRAAREAADRLGDAPADAAALAAAMAQVVLERMRRAHPTDGRVRTLVAAAAGGASSVGGWATALGVSVRTLRLLSHRHLGMSPKRFHRICRLHRALSLALPAPAEPGRWSRAAATAGYADHAHLVRDCRALLGEPPSAFAARAE